MHEKKILLVNPYINDFSAYDFWIKPLGLLYIAGILKKYRFKIYFIDLLDRKNPLLLQNLSLSGKNKIKDRKFGTGKFYSEIIQKPEIFKHIPRNYRRYGMPLNLFKKYLKEIENPDLILLTSGMTYWYPGVFETIKVLREFFNKTPIILGGIYASLCHEHALKNSGADFVIKNYEFEKLFEIIEDLTGVRMERTDFQKILLEEKPDYTLYSKINSCAIITSTGCPFNCIYCASALLWGRFVRSPVEKAFKEIKEYQKMGIKDIAFYDDALLFRHKEGFKELLERIIKQKIDIRFHTPNGIHAREIGKEIAIKLKKANFKTIRIGFESVFDERLKNEWSFKSSREVFLRAVKNLREVGFDDIGAYVIIGLKNQSIEEIVESYAFLYQNGVKIYPALFSPVPGTLYYKKWLEAKNLKDPLFTNKSIYPDKPDDISFKKYEKIKDFAKVLNREKGRKINVYKEIKEFLKQTTLKQ